MAVYFVHPMDGAEQVGGHQGLPEIAVSPRWERRGAIQHLLQSLNDGLAVDPEGHRLAVGRRPSGRPSFLPARLSGLTPWLPGDDDARQPI